MRKKKKAKSIISPSPYTEDSKVPINSFIEPREVKLLRGLKSLNVLIPETFENEGKILKRLVKTTIKSSQFQESLR